MVSMLPTSRSTSPVTVYINDVYYVLTNAIPNVTGTITVIQETQFLTATCFITLSDSPIVFADVNRPLVQSRANLEDH
jgi:hypothetical protein